MHVSREGTSSSDNDRSNGSRICVDVRDLSITYRVSSGALRGLFPNLIKSSLSRGNGRVEALRGVNLTVREGESVGLLGVNGSGKSTLLRSIAGLESPTKGTVRASSLPVLLGVGAALEPTLSGYENAKLGCLAVGVEPDVLDRVIDDIQGFVELGNAFYYPMETYSSGMASRLRFAIAIQCKPSILLIDEALSTGDAAFKEKSESRMRSFLDEAGTLFHVSHQAKAIQETCSRAIWLHEGQIIGDGATSELADEYRIWAWNKAKGNTEYADRVLARRLESHGLLENSYSAGGLFT